MKQPLKHQTVAGWVLFLLTAFILSGITPAASAQPIGKVGLTWLPNSEPDLKGYTLYWGTRSRGYDKKLAVGLTTQAYATDLRPGTTYYIAVTAVNTANMESEFSNEVVYTTPAGEPVGPVSGWEMERTADRVVMSWAMPPEGQGVGRWRVRWTRNGEVQAQEAYCFEPTFAFQAQAASTYTVTISAEGLQGWGPETTFQIPSMIAAPEKLAIKDGKMIWVFGSNPTP